MQIERKMTMLDIIEDVRCRALDSGDDLPDEQYWAEEQLQIIDSVVSLDLTDLTNNSLVEAELIKLSNYFQAKKRKIATLQTKMLTGSLDTMTSEEQTRALMTRIVARNNEEASEATKFLDDQEKVSEELFEAIYLHICELVEGEREFNSLWYCLDTHVTLEELTND